MLEGEYEVYVCLGMKKTAHWRFAAFCELRHEMPVFAQQPPQELVKVVIAFQLARISYYCHTGRGFFDQNSLQGVFFISHALVSSPELILHDVVVVERWFQ